VTKIIAALIVLAFSVVPAPAYHRQTPPIVRLTTSGDSTLPRLASGARRLVVGLDTTGRQIFLQDRGDNTLDPITNTGENDNPTASPNSHIIAWDSDCDVLGCAEPGRQIFMLLRGSVFQVTHDPTGTSINPALSGKGSLAFESKGDLASTGNAGVRQVFLRSADGVIVQVSSGHGTSRNAMLDRTGRSLVYESSNDLAGNETGIAQLWLVGDKAPLGPLTNGQGPSTRAAISPEGRIVVFESTAALIGDLENTGVPQIFAYRTREATFAQITNAPGGCTSASVARAGSDWAVAYVCGNQGFLHSLNANTTSRIPIDGDVSQAVTELGRHFMMVSTTANLLGSGTTAGRQLCMLNLFKYPLVPAAP
jgi:Tol biopolymer transport system component